MRERITPATLDVHARAIVEHTRLSGSPGENAAIDHIVESLRAGGVAVEVHTFETYASDPLSASVSVSGSDFAPQAITVSYSASVTGLEAPLVDVGALDDLPDLEVGTGERLVLEGAGMGGGPGEGELPDVEGRIALVTGQPRNVPVAVLERLGAVGVVFVNPEERLNELIVTSTWGTPSLLNYHRLPTLPVAEVMWSAGEVLRDRLARGTVTVRMSTETRTGWKPLRLAVARIPGPSPDAPYVLLGGHIDGWYHGATDEGASNAAMVELTRAFHAQREELRRGLVVAWWPGHSNARYAGSTWFADRYFDELRRRAVAYLNVDGIGQRGAKTFGAATTASLAGLARTVVRQREAAGIEPFRPGRNSDQAFNGVGLPLLQLYHNRLEEDGGYWWWHTPEDTYDKIDLDVLKTDTDLYVDALATLLAAPRLPLDLEAQVAQLGEALRRHEVMSGERLDLSRARAPLYRLGAAVGALQGALEGATPGPDLDASLVELHRTIHRVLYVPLSPWHPDPGVGWTLLPGLVPARILAEEDSTSDRYRFAETSLEREVNRLVEVLERATAEAEALAARLGGSR
ncbi:MAG: M28 family peptidase [Gemmatimonadetes bacterium]|nr:M28 family peptidase [Gemmatimonadota bacterium]NIR77222.1 M28 family peptidase [Gemmatimonadota bacterium]NIT85739.1 M28 family peptidase [Gemmatimonadota bacterium]NIU29566.1 M28 family peptidase [Gemmatimonadota bacterium]NIU34615.1 M28 family peptidase [Gemmatimonadota bacterium]